MTANFRLTLYPLQAACIRLADVSRKSFQENNLSVNTLQLIKLYKYRTVSFQNRNSYQVATF